MVHWDDLDLALEPDSGAPLYRQIRDQIAARITAGVLSPGRKLPPSRDLARRLAVNRATVASAYDLLASEGLIRSRVGQGTFVAGGEESPAPSAPSIAWSFSRAMEAVQRSPVGIAPRNTHPDSIDFASLMPDEELFPIEPFRRLLNAALKRRGKHLLQYGPPAGYRPLREYIARRLAARGVGAAADDVLIVNGSQQGLDLVCRAFLDPGDAVVVESPTYHVILPLLSQYRAVSLPVPMTERGLDLPALAHLLSKRPVKLIYTMPTFHNPTGITMDLATRRELVRLAQTHRVPVVEDDFDWELRFDGPALPPLKAFDGSGLVLHLGTFSKGLFPGLRLGWMVTPREVGEILSRAKLFADYHTSSVLQAGVLEFCRRGHYDAHLRKLAEVYQEKSRRLVEAMARHFPAEVTWTKPQGGYAYWVELPEGISSEALLSGGHRLGVLFTPGTLFYASSEGDRYLRLSISRVPVDRIEEGVRRLAELVRQQLAAERPRGERAHEAVFHI